MANKKKITEKQLKTSKAGGALIGKRNGQTIIHNKGTLGGYAVGRLHSEGGIKGKVEGGGQDVEFQGGEVTITAPSVAMQQKQEFNGEMLSVRQILSKINVWGGGVSFAEGGEIPSKIKSSGKKYTYGGKLVKDHDIISSCGCQHEDPLQAEEGKFEKGGQMSRLKEPKNFNRAIKKSKFKIYDIIVNEFDSGGFDGGCVIVANAIKKIIGGEIVVLVRKSNIADHAAVKIGHILYDLDGARPEKEFISYFNNSESAKCVAIRKIAKKDLPNTPVNDAASQRIADIILSNAGEIKKMENGGSFAEIKQNILSAKPDDFVIVYHASKQPLSFIKPSADKNFNYSQSGYVYVAVSPAAAIGYVKIHSNDVYLYKIKIQKKELLPDTGAIKIYGGKNTLHESIEKYGLARVKRVIYGNEIELVDNLNLSDGGEVNTNKFENGGKLIDKNANMQIFFYGRNYPVPVPADYSKQLIKLLINNGFTIDHEYKNYIDVQKNGHLFFVNDNGGELNLGDRVSRQHIGDVPYHTNRIVLPEVLFDGINQLFIEYYEPEEIIIEPINEQEEKRERESEIKDEYEKKRQSLDEFFTPKWVADIMYKLALRHGFDPSAENANICEPSFGHGVFFDAAIENGVPENHLYGFEIFQANVDFVKNKYPLAHLVNQNFEYEFAKNDKALIRDGINKSVAFQDAKFTLFLGNPPYGYHKSPYSYLWDNDLQVRIEGFFIYLCLQKLEKNGLLVFIINSLWLYNKEKYNKQKEKIFQLGVLIDAYRLPSNTFVGENRDTSIATDIVVFRKK